MAFSDYQFDIYRAGLRGVLPTLPTDAKGLETRAVQALAPAIVSYVQGGSGDELTQSRNIEGFGAWGIVPRMLVDTSNRELGVDLFGVRLPSPVFMSPVGVAGLCTSDGHGDLAAARAARNTGVPFIGSTLMNDPMEAVATELGGTPGFFQLYTPRDPELAASFIQRAEKAGYMAIVVTLDTWIPGWRPRDLNAANFPQLRGHVLANYFTDPVFRARLARPPEEDPQAAIGLWAEIFGRTLTWRDLPWLRSLTKLPLVLKGICHPDDARRALDGGVDAIYCSNHGGRQANGGIAAIDHLPEVVAACGDAPVLFDSGVRSGTDVVKALALGATAVGIGRPFLYGLALAGAAGAEHVLKSILAEADLFMAVNGFPSLSDLRRAGARRVGFAGMSSSAK
jgi:lactate 2-monooxygenase